MCGAATEDAEIFCFFQITENNDQTCLNGSPEIL